MTAKVCVVLLGVVRCVFCVWGSAMALCGASASVAAACTTVFRAKVVCGSVVKCESSSSMGWDMMGAVAPWARRGRWTRDSRALCAGLESKRLESRHWTREQATRLVETLAKQNLETLAKQRVNLETLAKTELNPQCKLCPPPRSSDSHPQQTQTYRTRNYN